jgi:ABC-type transporter Mla subunit MlaD
MATGVVLRIEGEGRLMRVQGPKAADHSRSGADEQDELDALLEGASALVADVAQLGAQDLETLRPLSDAAAEALGQMFPQLNL